METLINIFGYAAAICVLCGYMPQAIYTMRTRNTDGIALPTFLSMGVGSVFFVVQGALIGNWPLIITNTITAVCCAVITVIKLQNDRRKRDSALYAEANHDGRLNHSGGSAVLITNLGAGRLR